jgi:hypothetical protein
MFMENVFWGRSEKNKIEFWKEFFSPKKHFWGLRPIIDVATLETNAQGYKTFFSRNFFFGILSQCAFLSQTCPPEQNHCEKSTKPLQFRCFLVGSVLCLTRKD